MVVLVRTAVPHLLQTYHLNLPFENSSSLEEFGEYTLTCMCGGVVAEKTFLNLRSLANKYPNLNCVAVSHCTKESTDRWVSALGGAWNVRVVSDRGRGVYARWGLGLGTTYYGMCSSFGEREREEGIGIRWEGRMKLQSQSVCTACTNGV